MNPRSSETQYLKVDGSLLKLTHLEKIFYPQTGFRKKDILHYYQQIAPIVLPHLRDRPFTFIRFPNGVEQPSFYQKQCPPNHPDWVKMGQLHTTNHCILNNEASLLWAANLGAIELHTTLGKTVDLENPTLLALDLDPGPGADLQLCAQIALEIERKLQRYHLQLFPKTSGKKGLHLFIPLNTTKSSYKKTALFAKWIAEEMERCHGDLSVSKMAKKLRAGKIFIDWSQNKDFKTTCTVYSLRANDIPSVSTPITWKELRDIAKKPREARRFLQMEQSEVLARVKKQGDLFSPVLEIRQSLPHLTAQSFRAA